jgi:hypothetical protein
VGRSEGRRRDSPPGQGKEMIGWIPRRRNKKSFWVRTGGLRFSFVFWLAIYYTLLYIGPRGIFPCKLWFYRSCVV